MSCLCNELAGPGLKLSPACLGGLWVFENLKPEEQKALAETALRKRYERGQYIFMEGEPARTMFLIKAGRVKLSKFSEIGTEITLDIRKAGDFLGENMLNEDTEFPVSAICLETTLICGFTRQGFEEMVLAHPNIGLQVIRNLSRRIDLADQPGGRTMSYTNLEDGLIASWCRWPTNTETAEARRGSVWTCPSPTRS
jgi:CRP/FNR family transcriptional regulator